MSATPIPIRSPHPPDRTEQLLYGHDPTDRIVSVEPSGPDRMRLLRRNTAGELVAEDANFAPWLVAARSEPWSAIRPRPTIDRLDGDHPLCYLVRFPSWPAYHDAARAAQDARESFFRFRSPVEQFLVASGRTLFKGMIFDDVQRLQLDIETTGFDAEKPNVEVVMAALSTNQGSEEVLVNTSGEAELLSRLTERIQTLDPDVIEGHNLFNFDLPFLVTRAARYGIALAWGRDGSPIRIAPNPARFKAGALTLPFTPAYVNGRHIVDTYQQIQRYDTGGRLTSYGLKAAVEELGLTRPGREFVPGEQIRDIWQTDPDRLERYALDDVRDVDILSRLATPTEFYQAQLLPRSFQAVATGGPGEKINDLFVRAYLSQHHSLPVATTARDYPGGHAELLETGVFSPVVKCDVESLYPSIMLQDGIVSKADTLAATLPMLADLTRHRLEAKVQSRLTAGQDRAMWEGMQSSFKVLINSFYGYLGYGRGLFNDYDAAEAVTLAGQRIVKHVVERLRDTGATPIEVDTDGVYFVPPSHIKTAKDELTFVAMLGETLPPGIRLAHDGSYRGMLSLRLKTYALLDSDGTMLLKGSALRSRRVERCLHAFIEGAARHFLQGEHDQARDLYFALAERIRNRDVPLDQFIQWGMVHQETLGSQPRLRRLMERVGARDGQPVRAGDRIQYYERVDGELALADEYADDENSAYLLRRLRDVAERFRPLFRTDAEFTAFFPPLSPRTDLDAARQQEASQQLNMF